MDKVIIDNVDVSECDAYTHNHNELMPYGDIQVTEHYCYHVNSECNGKDCEYKQLQRARAEIECLKEKIEIANNSDKRTLEIIAENEKLKEENNYLSKDRLKQIARKAINSKLSNKYKQCLKEIKEIVLLDSSLSRSDTKANIISMYDRIESIVLDKISEVIGVDDV